MNNRKSMAILMKGATVVLMLTPTLLVAQSAPAIEEILIKAIRDDRQSRGATGLDLGVYETPQSLSILDAETISDFGLRNINTMLSVTTGVNVDSTETDRTYYNSRGFDITSMHIDGIGVPFGSLIVGDLDTAIYEKVEVLRGSNGLITGLGNPSGTINYVRKRPGNEFAANTSFTLGRWDEQRLVTDISTPLTDDGRWAARFVGVYQDNASWLDHYANNRKVGSVFVDGQITDSITLGFGYTYQDNNSDGVLWGAAPIINTSGEQLDFDESTTTTMDWTYWDTLNETAYAELGWQISDNLNLTSSVTQTDYEDNGELFYVYWNTGLDADTGLGMFAYPGKYDSIQETLIWDTVVRSAFTAWGREHQFNVGLSIADKDSIDLDHAALSGFDAMPAFPGWAGNEVARPNWAAPNQAGDQDISLNRLYGSLLLSITETFNLILGASKVDYENRGVSFGVSTDSDEDGGSPYLGFTWEVADNLNLYGSYSDIYQPQYYLDEDQQPLGSAEGRSYELGLKKQFDNGLLTSIALFRTEQENLQEFVGYGDGDDIDDTDYSDDFTFAEYRGIDVDADGIELEVAGNLTDEIRLQAGYTHLKLEDPNGNDARTFIPRNTFKLLAAYQPAILSDLNLGLSARWQDEIYFDSSFGRVSQDSYTLIGGFVNYNISDSLNVALNLENITDEKYLSSVRFEQAFFAQPLNYRLSINWDY
ncbi:MAG: TonB-dependent siderophore receptor [Gammaproteobacteria bacterium]